MRKESVIFFVDCKIVALFFIFVCNKVVVYIKKRSHIQENSRLRMLQWAPRASIEPTSPYLPSSLSSPLPHLATPLLLCVLSPLPLFYIFPFNTEITLKKNGKVKRKKAHKILQLQYCNHFLSLFFI